MDYVRLCWDSMFAPPWRKVKWVRNISDRVIQLLFWLAGWCWSLLGLTLGVLIAPLIITRLGLANTPYQYGVAFGIVAVCALIVQLINFTLLLVLVVPIAFIVSVPFLIAGVPVFIAALLLPPLRRVITGRVGAKAVDRMETGVFLLAVIAYTLLSIWYGSDMIWLLTQTHDVQRELVITYAIGGLIVKWVVSAIVFGGILARLWKQLKKGIGAGGSKVD